MPSSEIWGWNSTTKWTKLAVDSSGRLLVDVNPSKTATTVLDEASIAISTTTALGDCTATDLSGGVETLALTVEATYNAAATQGIKVHVRTSYDGTNYDTIDWDSWNASFTANTTIRESTTYATDPSYIKVLIENLDGAVTVTDVKVIMTVGA